ncbi:CaiB/BaiF CoA transferase family protein [Piscinibacter koreensis]|uniref:CoA transferase n=1 Tax=Piscinibacter koreensis TaxID=2742824 RepID=A0A7Y6NRT7_9BURK|nr:CoA transferase [Schlegelella koreensis]NUZ08017.1 CoA transferase [Schlegelella koreensis]
MAVLPSHPGAAAPAPAAPLAGVSVLDFGQYIAGPGAAMALADLGASVIKVESLGGDQARHIGRYGESMIRAYNRGKRSIALDLKSQAGREIAWRLIARSDVVIQNLRPGVVEKLGLGPADVRARHPRVIYLSISGFGSAGPSRDRPGYDIAAQAESGLMTVTGEPDRLPQKVGVPVVDAAAAQLGAQAVLAALYGRERSGVGETLEVSLLETALNLQAATFCEYLGGGPEPTRIGAGQPHNAPAAEVVPTSDGHIVLSAYAEDHWQRFCRVVGREELIDDPRFSSNQQRVAHRAELREVLGECLSKYTSEQCVTLLGRNQIVVGAVRRYRDVLASPDVIASGIVVDAQGPDGAHYRALGLPYRMGDAPRPAPAAAPACGADGAAVLAEAGYSDEEIAALRQRGVIA